MLKQIAFATLIFGNSAVSALAADTESPQVACKSDIETYCSGVEKGEGRVMKCLKEHKEQLSEGCKTSLRSMQQKGQNKSKEKGGASTGSSTLTCGRIIRVRHHNHGRTKSWASAAASTLRTG